MIIAHTEISLIRSVDLFKAGVYTVDAFVKGQTFTEGFEHPHDRAGLPRNIQLSLRQSIADTFLGYMSGMCIAGICAGIDGIGRQVSKLNKALNEPRI